MLEALLILLGAAGAQGPAADPLAQARAGKIQCIMPNKAKKSCVGLATYSVRPDGSFDVVSTVLVAPTPLIAMETRSAGKVEGDMLCSVIRQQEYAEAKVTLDGAAADPTTSTAVRTQIAGMIAALDGKKACSREVAEGDSMRIDVTIEGTARPDLTQRAIWVGANEGYKLGM